MKTKWKGKISLWLVCVLILTILPASVSADSEYAITKDDGTMNGTYIVKINGNEVTSAASGQTVTIETYPDPGYKVNAVTYREKDDFYGVPVFISLGGDGNGSFVMPDYGVLIEASFQKLTAGEETPGPGTEEPDPGTDPTPGPGTEEPDPGTDPTPGPGTEEPDPGTDPTPGPGTEEPDPGTDPTPGPGTEEPDPGTDPTPGPGTEEPDPGTDPTPGPGTEDPEQQLPEIGIELEGTTNCWSSFSSDVSFDLMYGKAQSLKIKVTEAEGSTDTSTVQYYLANDNLFQRHETYTSEQIERVIAGRWNNDTGTINLTSDGRYVLYVKATDSKGNAVYANTQGIVIDTTAPIIFGVKDGNVYYGVTSFMVQDAYLNSVTIDGKVVQSVFGMYAIQPDNMLHEIIATDRMGNKVSCKISVCETWVRDGIQKNGVYKLLKGTAYKLGEGKWKIMGDSTIYQGGTTIYVSSTGDYDFRKQ